MPTYGFMPVPGCPALVAGCAYRLGRHNLEAFEEGQEWVVVCWGDPE